MTRPVLRLGSVGEDVRDWQKIVRSTVTGRFDSGTERATRIWQAANLLTVDGEVGPESWGFAEGPEVGDPTASMLTDDAREVPRVATPLGSLEMAAVLRDAHHAVVGSFPSPKRLGMAWAHCALENDHGKAIHCHNFGNVSAYKWPGLFFVIRVPEQTDPTNPDPAKRWKEVDMRFRAHADFIDGGRDYWRQMTTTFGSAMPAADAGDPTAFTRALKARKYFSAPEPPYAAALRGLYPEFARRILPRL